MCAYNTTSVCMKNLKIQLRCIFSTAGESFSVLNIAGRSPQIEQNALSRKHY